MGLRMAASLSEVTSLAGPSLSHAPGRDVRVLLELSVSSRCVRRSSQDGVRPSAEGRGHVALCHVALDKAPEARIIGRAAWWPWPRTESAQSRPSAHHLL